MNADNMKNGDAVEFLTDLQTGLMALTRSVAKPEFF